EVARAELDPLARVRAKQGQLLVADRAGGVVEADVGGLDGRVLGHRSAQELASGLVALAAAPGLGTASGHPRRLGVFVLLVAACARVAGELLGAHVLVI